MLRSPGDHARQLLDLQHQAECMTTLSTASKKVCPGRGTVQTLALSSRSDENLNESRRQSDSTLVDSSLLCQDCDFEPQAALSPRDCLVIDPGPAAHNVHERQHDGSWLTTHRAVSQSATNAVWQTRAAWQVNTHNTSAAGRVRDVSSPKSSNSSGSESDQDALSPPHRLKNRNHTIAPYVPLAAFTSSRSAYESDGGGYSDMNPTAGGRGGGARGKGGQEGGWIRRVGGGRGQFEQQDNGCPLNAELHDHGKMQVKSFNDVENRLQAKVSFCDDGDGGRLRKQALDISTVLRHICMRIFIIYIYTYT